MAIRTTCRLADPFGTHLTEIAQFAKLDYVLNCSPGGVGVLELTLPTSFDTSLLRRDGRIGVWRSIDGRPAYQDNNAIYLIETFDYTDNATFVRAYHATTLLARRIVAYYAGSSYATKTGAADDLIKEYWDENAGSSSSVAIRDGPNDAVDQTDISAYVSLQADHSAAASVEKSAARRNLLEVATELAQASATAGTYLTFEIIAPTESTLELRTYTGQRGVDRRASTANPVILSKARGNLENAHLVVDYHEQVTFVLAGGVGEEINRFTGYAIDNTRMASSPFGRIERFVDASNLDTVAALADEADAAMWAWRESVDCTGDLIETPGLTRGIDFDLGDIVTAEHPRTRQQFDVRIDVIRETIDANGRKAQIGLRNMT